MPVEDAAICSAADAWGGEPQAGRGLWGRVGEVKMTYGRRRQDSERVDRSRGAGAVRSLVAAALIAVGAAACWPARRSAGAADRSRSAAPSAPRPCRSPSASPRTCASTRSFVDIMVGDPEVADVNPLTDRTLSILGKKIGTTRVSVYAEGKKLVGVFDVEVAYDTSLLQTEIRRRFPRASLRVSAVNGRIMLSGTSPDGADARPGGDDRQQFGPESSTRSRSTAPQQVMLEVRFIEATRAGRPRTRRAVERVRQPHARQYRQSQPTASCRSPTPAAMFTTPASRSAANDRRPVDESAVASPACCPARRRSASWSAAWSRAASTTDVMINALEQKGLARTLAEPNLVALSGDTASFLAGGEYPDPGAGRARPGHDRLQALRRRPRLHADRAGRRPDQPEDRAGGQPARHQPSGAGRRGISVPALIVRRASTTVELRDGQSFVIGGLLQSDGKNAICSSCRGSATCRCSARCSAARPTRRTRPISPSSSRRGWCGRRGPGDVDRDAARQHAAGQRRRLLPDGQDRRSAAPTARQSTACRRASSPATCSICRREAANVVAVQLTPRCSLARRRCARRDARRLLGHLSRPPRDRRARRRRCGRGQPRHADGRSVAAGSANRNIAFNGEKMQTAAERYRTGTSHPAGQRRHHLGA